MTVDELTAACLASQQAMGREDAGVYLVLPARRSGGYSEDRRLAGRSGPIGEICCETEMGETVLFKANEVLRWLKRQTT
jgi:hypothetical protein